MTPEGKDPRKLLETTEKRFPNAVRLARVVSLASRIEPELLRQARLQLLPSLDAGAEADLWFSPLVQSSTPLALTLRPAVADLLRRDLAKSPESLKSAWELLEQVHQNAPAAIQLEERVTWQTLAGGPDALERVEKELMSVVSAITTQKRSGLARWALRAVPRLPEEARRTKAATILFLTAAAQVDAWHLVEKQVESNTLDAGFINDLQVVLPRNLPKVQVGLRLLENGDYLTNSERGYLVEFNYGQLLESAQRIEVPGTVPLMIEVSWEVSGKEEKKHVSLYQGKTETIAVPVNRVVIRTAAGDVYTLSESHEANVFDDIEPSVIPALDRIPREPLIGFVPRRSGDRDLVEELKIVLARSGNRVVQIVGAGGVGKTTLAAQVARELIKTVEQNVLWLTAEGRSDFNVNTLLNEIAVQLGHPEMRSLGSRDKPRELKSLLRRMPSLIFIDNFEVIESREQVRCLNFLKSAETVGVIVSRQHLEGPFTYIIELMSEIEAVEFLFRLQRLKEKNLFGDLGPRHIAAVCGSNPLAMRLFVAQLAFTGNVEAALKDIGDSDIRKSKDDPVIRVYDRSVNLPELGDDGRTMLRALALFVPSASRAALSAVAGFGDDHEGLESRISALQQLELISVTPGADRLMVEGSVRDLLNEPADRYRDSLSWRFVDYFLAYTEQHSHATAEDFDALDLEVENLLDAMDMAVEFKRSAELIRICIAMSRFFDVRGYWDESLKRNAQALKMARATKQAQLVPVINQTIGGIYLRRRQLTKAETAYRAVLRAYSKADNGSGIATTLRQLGSIAADRSRLKEAEQLYLQALDISRRLNLTAGIADNLHNLAIIAQEQGDLDRAQRWYQESLEITGDQGNVAISLHQLGVIAHEKGELSRARDYFEQSLAIKRRLGDRNGTADSLHELGLLLGDLKLTDQAERCLTESLSIYEQLGSPSAEEVRTDLNVLRQPDEGRLESQAPKQKQSKRKSKAPAKKKKRLSSPVSRRNTSLKSRRRFASKKLKRASKVVKR